MMTKRFRGSTIGKRNVRRIKHVSEPGIEREDDIDRQVPENLQRHDRLTCVMFAEDEKAEEDDSTDKETGH